MKLDLTKEMIKDSFSYSEVCRKVNWVINGTTIKLVKQFITDNNLDASHFDRYKSNRDNRVYELITKSCPVCNKTFTTNLGQKREQIVCSHSCSNTFFRSGVNNPNWKDPEDKKDYRSICFMYHKKECVICKENLIVAVHHLDENHNNNSPENLVPLCPTHHQYWHSKYKHLIESKVLDYINNYIKSISL
jgi:hypothetical protein